MKPDNTIRRAIDAQLSGVRRSPEMEARVMHAIQGGKKMKKKTIAALAFALALTMLTVGALGMGLLKAPQYDKIEKARAALQQAYGLTGEMLALFSTRQNVQNETTVFYTIDSEFVNAEKTGEYTVSVDARGNAAATWSHDDTDKALWETGDLNAPVWGAPQLQAVLDRHAYYRAWQAQNESPYITSYPIAEQLRRYAELDAAIAPIQMLHDGRTLSPTADDLSEAAALTLAKASLAAQGVEAGEGWTVYRSLTANAGGKYYDVAFVKGAERYRVKVATPSGEILGAEAATENVLTEDEAAARLTAAKDMLRARFGLTEDMLALFTPTVARKTVTFGMPDAHNTRVDWRWANTLGDRMGVYTVSLDEQGNAVDAQWSLDKADATYTDGRWATAKAYDAAILTQVLTLLDQNAPIIARYPEETSDWFSAEDAAAYDERMRAAGFSAETYNHCLPNGVIDEAAAKQLAVDALCEAYGISPAETKAWTLWAEFVTDAGGMWHIHVSGTGAYATGYVMIQAQTGEILGATLDSIAIGNG